MRRLLFAAFLLVLPMAAPAHQPEDPPPLHSERTPFSELRVEEYDAIVPLRKGDMILRHADGKPMIASRYTFRKLIQNDILYGTQFTTHERHILDDFQMIMPGVSPWDAVAVTGVTHAYDIRQEPLSYYHRTGPVGAVFSELRRRKGGADEKAPVGVFGLQTGAEACYCRPGQKITFYETDPALVRLTAESDRFFTHIADARRRGVEVEVRVGDRRKNLAADKDRKFALLLVDQSESFPVPKDILTVEAVRLYFDRLTDDGILAVHTSSKYLDLEAVVSRVAAELTLTARIWNDDSEGRAGKVASSWGVLARKPEHLGLLAPPGMPAASDEQVAKFGHAFRPAKRVVGVPLWTDAHADAGAVTKDEGVQRVRKFFGLPTPVER